MEGEGNKIIAAKEKGTWPNTIPDIAITLSGCFFTIPFQIACIIVAKKTIKKTLVSIVNNLFNYIFNLGKGIQLNQINI